MISKIFPSSSLYRGKNRKYANFPDLWGEENLNISEEENEKNIGFSSKNGKNFFFDINTMLFGKEDSFKENINIKINKKSEEEKENKDNDCEDKINFCSREFSKDCNYEFSSIFLKKDDEKCHDEFYSNKNYNNWKNDNCSNKKNSTTDISNLNNIPINLDKNNYNKKVFCKCSKSGCKLKYCECFKAKQECTHLCRCFNCRNSKNPKMIFNNKYNEVYPANSIKIIHNILFEEENQGNCKGNLLNKKRKKSQCKDIKNCKNDINNEDKNLFVNKGQKPFDEDDQIVKYSKLTKLIKY